MDIAASERFLFEPNHVPQAVFVRARALTLCVCVHARPPACECLCAFVCVLPTAHPRVLLLYRLMGLRESTDDTDHGIEGLSFILHVVKSMKATSMHILYGILFRA